MIKTLYFLFFVVIFSLGLWACSEKPKDKFTNLNSDQFEQLIQDPNIQLVDVRTLAEYTEGHLPGSLQLNVLDTEFSTCADSLLEPGRPVAVYCKSGRRSRKAAKLLTEKGFKVYNLDKGFLNWKELGKDIEQ